MSAKAKSTPEFKESLEILKNYLEIIGKSVLGLVAICYAAGLVVESIYYSHFGVTAFSLLRLNYILAGIWVLGPYLLVVLFSVLLWSIFPLSPISKEYELVSHGPFKSKWATFVLLSLVFTTIIFLIIIIFRYFIIRTAFNDDWIAVLWFGVGTALNLCFFMSLYPEHRKAINQSNTGKLRFGLSAMALILTPIAYCLIAGPIVYRLVPSELGGGKLRYAKFLIKGNKTTFAELSESGVQFHSEVPEEIKDPKDEFDRLTFNSQIIAFTEKDYFVFLSNGSTISISRDIVKAVSY